jgi:ribosomal-protein-alanine N-acetyltransferase
MVVFAIRRADADDLAEILALERVNEGAPHWSEAMWSDLLTGSGNGPVQRVVLAARMEGELAGFLVAGAVAEIAELDSVVVAEVRRGCGIGKALCRSGMAWARENGARSMELEVRESNVAAISLYVSLGFVEQGRRAGYYRDPDEGAVLMEVALNGG